MKQSLLFTLISGGLLTLTIPVQAQCPNCPKWWTFPYVWIANSGENTVSKIEITSGCELGRYRTGPDGEDPSRIAVDRYGDAWVLNRTSSTAVKIAASPYDRDNDGPITTSQDTNHNCVIEPGEVLPWNVGFPPQDEAILMRIPVDSGPRAVAVDRYNNVWIGGAGGNMGYYSGKTGQRFKVINIRQTLYNALIDKKGRLWITHLCSNSLTRIDAPDMAHIINNIPLPPAHNCLNYGIAADLSGYIYVSGWSSNVLSRCKPTAGNCNWSWNGPTSVPTGTNARGVAVDFFGDIWVASSGNNAVYRHNAATGQIVKTISVGTEPTGVATAADGRIWVTNRWSNNVMRINPRTEQVDLTHSPHPGTYAIGDFTGIIYNSITLPALPIHPIYGKIMSTPPVIASTAEVVTQEGSGFIEIPRDPSEEIPPILPLPEGVEDPEASYFN